MESIPIKSETRLSLESELDNLKDRFLSSLDVKPNSRKTYERGLKQFFLWFKSQSVYTPSREDILAYKRYLESQKLSALTVSSYLVVCRKFFEYTEGIKFYPNIAKGIKGARRPKGFRKDALTVGQIKELLASSDRSTVEGLRNHAILGLLVRTGIRTIELTRADVGDIRPQAGEIVLWVWGKGRDVKDEFVILTEAALKPIREYLNRRGSLKDGDPLFVSASDRNKNQRLTPRSVSRIVKEHLKKVSINNGRTTAHSLRHTAITLALQGGATIQEAQALGRHASVDTTLLYAHNFNRVLNAAEKKIDDVLRDNSDSELSSAK